MIETPMGVPLLEELVIILVFSIVILFLSHRLRLPSVIGLLLTGILIGPGGLRLIKDSESIRALAEIGVVMLLFIIGLEFSTARLKHLKKNFWLGGASQIVLTVLVALAVFRFLRFPVGESVFYGFLISLSSTAVVMKILSDRGESDSPQGNIALGILLFQDFSLVPMIALTPLLARASTVSVTRLGLRFLISVAVLVGVVAVARFIMPRVLYFIVRTRIREAFLITSLLICLGMALLTFSFGLSLALGAFVAGLIISESEYSHQVASEVMPFKDLFNSIFFISIGMLLNVGFARDRFLPILVLSLALIVIKSLLVFLAVLLLRYPPRTALLCGLALAQVGEFSFVLAGLGRAHGLMTEDVFQVFIASSILTIMATPVLIQLAPRVADKSGRLLRFLRPPRGAAEQRAVGLKNHVIIAGYGLNGRNLARVLKETGIPYAILELNPDSVREAAREGEPILFGDISSPEILRAAGLERAHVIVFVISDPGATRSGVRIARQLNRDISIIVRTRYVSEIDELYSLGADQVIPEEFETSIEIFTRTLAEFHVPRNVIDAQAHIIRSERYGMLRGRPKGPRPMEKISALLTAGTAETFLVSGDCPASGKTLGELDLRRQTGATAIAVVRGEQPFVSPAPDFRIVKDDILVLVANHQDMDRALRFLEPPRTEPDLRS